MGRLQLGKKFQQVIQSDKFQQAAQGAAQGALGALQSTSATTSIQSVQKQKTPAIPKEYIVAAAIVIAALIGARRR
tara:strand:- start:247 stop:474 length:228 start_codon:yes stop_codon:yes gene_type:complete